MRREESYEERRKTCGKCVNDGVYANIVGSVCYLCKRNPVDNRTDRFEEKKDENMNMTIEDVIDTINSEQRDMFYHLIIDTLNSEQRDMFYHLISYAAGTGRNYIAGNGDFDNHIQRKLRKTYNELNKIQKNVVTYLVDKAINDFRKERK